MTTSPAPVRLDDLISAITTHHDETLDQLAGAVLLADQLGELADALIGHFVDQARRSGASWSEIGRSLGVTKQAAQKRFVPKGQDAPALDPSQGFSRFTDDARAAVVGAQEAARDAGNATITAAHLVLGLLGVPGSPAVRAVEAQGADVEAVRRTASAALPAAGDDVPALIPFDAHARQTLELTFAHAQRLGADAVDSGHVLLALLEAEDGTGALAGHGIDPARTEAELAAV